MSYIFLIGSLRRDSRYAALAESLYEEIGNPDIKLIKADLPLFNGDKERSGEEPDCPSAVRLRKKLRESDGVVFFAPEYNGLPSASLLNAIDWSSRRPDEPLKGKKAMVVSGESKNILESVLQEIGMTVVSTVDPGLILRLRNGLTAEDQAEILRVYKDFDAAR